MSFSTVRIAEATVAFGRLLGNIWGRSGIWKSTRLWYCQPSYMNVRLLTPCQKTKSFPLKLPEKTPEDEVARQYPGHRSPEKRTDAKREHSVEAWAAAMDWPCHKNPDEQLPKRVFYRDLQVGKLQGGQEKRYKDTLKVSPKDFNIPPECLKQSAQDRSKWRCLIRKGEDDYEAKRVCEAERKRKERKARAAGSSSGSSFSELTCSVCKRHFTAKSGLISHQRPQQHT